MHLIVGFIRIMLANALAAVYCGLRFDVIGRRAVRLTCSAFTAGAGLDDAALQVVRRMGPDGVRLLQEESNRRGEGSIASLMLKMLRTSSDA